ncbi:MAG TPA: glycerol kinase GlpK [Gemmatimonadales bacterium]|nr:glycerol kinase GlpK [Gemmatimonadales bacterium]
MKSVLAVDEGTTGSRALVIGEDGRVLGRGYREIPQHFPRPGWVEHDPEDLWRATLDAARDALGQAGTRPDALGITNQRETVCVWDRKSGRPLARAIVWQDRRTADRCAALAASPQGALIRDRTGLVLDPYFSGTKIEWLMQQVPGVRDQVSGGDAVFGTVDSWLLYRLTGGKTFATDHTNASRTLLYDIHRRTWDDDLLGIFGVPKRALAEVRASSGDFGVATAEHFGFEIPVLGIAGDQQAALFGQGCWKAGEAKNTYGTGAFLLLNTGDRPARSTSGLLTTVACDAKGRPAYALEGSVFIAGAAVQWLRDGLGIIGRADETDAIARSVPDSGGVTFVPAFVGLGAPQWETAARGTIVGLTRGTTRAHLVRATLEAMAYSTQDLLAAMVADSGLALSALQVDGGASANDWLMQFQADVLGVTVARPDLVETTALGAAGLAGVAAGVWGQAEDFLARRTFRRFSPGPGVAAAASRLHDWRRAVDTALWWARAGRDDIERTSKEPG